MTTETPTPTPRTDNQETTGDRMQYSGVVSVVFARQLERELTNARLIGLNEAADIAARIASEHCEYAKTGDMDARLTHLDKQGCALEIEKAIRMASMPNEKRSATGDQDVPPAKRTDSDTAGWLHRLVRPTGHSQNENESACSSPDTSGLPESAYKNGRVTFSGVMMTPEGCQKSFENWFGERTPQFRAWGKGVLARWKESGYPSLGDWPPQEVEVDLLVYSLGVMCGASRPNAEPSQPASTT